MCVGDTLFGLDIQFRCAMKCALSNWLQFLIKMRFWMAVLAYVLMRKQFQKLGVCPRNSTAVTTLPSETRHCRSKREWTQPVSSGAAVCGCMRHPTQSTTGVWTRGPGRWRNPRTAARLRSREPLQRGCPSSFLKSTYFRHKQRSCR